MLGSIDATWLSEFWDGVEPKAAAKLKADDWELHSLHERTAFWEKANHRLKLLANRLGPEAKRIRMAAHARVPWPMKPEREKLELLVGTPSVARARRRSSPAITLESHGARSTSNTDRDA